MAWGGGMEHGTGVTRCSAGRRTTRLGFLKRSRHTCKSPRLVDAITGKVSPGNHIEQEALIRGCALFPDDQGGRLITALVWPGCVVLALVLPGCVSALLLPS